MSTTRQIARWTTAKLQEQYDIASAHNDDEFMEVIERELEARDLDRHQPVDMPDAGFEFASFSSY